MLHGRYWDTYRIKLSYQSINEQNQNKMTQDIIPILKEMEKLDETDRFFVFGFSKYFDNEFIGMRLALDVLSKVKISKESINQFREAELLGELVGNVASLLIYKGL